MQSLDIRNLEDTMADLAQSDLVNPMRAIELAWEKLEGWGRAARRDKAPKLPVSRESFLIALKFAVEDMSRESDNRPTVRLSDAIVGN